VVAFAPLVGQSPEVTRYRHRAPHAAPGRASALHLGFVGYLQRRRWRGQQAGCRYQSHIVIDPVADIHSIAAQIQAGNRRKKNLRAVGVRMFTPQNPAKRARHKSYGFSKNKVISSTKFNAF
jgi:hypothetical protein